MLHHAGDSQHAQNIQINNVIGENAKCHLFHGKKLYQLFGQPNLMMYIHYYGITQSNFTALRIL